MVSLVDVNRYLLDPGEHLLWRSWLRFREPGQQEHGPAFDTLQKVCLGDSSGVLVDLELWPSTNRLLVVRLLQVDEANLFDAVSHHFHGVEWTT